MLTSAERDLVARDPQLPGLRFLLDLDALTVLVAEHTGHLRRLEAGRLRYKPGISCVLSFELHPLDGGVPVPCIAKAYAPPSAVKADKSLLGVPESDVLVIDRDARLVVTTIAGDRHLGGATLLFDAATAPRLLRRLLPNCDRLDGGTIRTLRHNPERRWVGVLESGPDRVVLRVYRAAEAAPIRVYRRLYDGSPRTPALWGTSNKHAMIATEWVDGESLDRSASLPGFSAAGVALAQLHGRAPRHHLERVTAEHHHGRLVRAATQVTTLLPVLGPDVDELTASLQARLVAVPEDVRTLHGDFSADQVVCDALSTTLIDLDSVCAGHPAQDLGSLWAAALASGPSGPSDPSDPSHPCTQGQVDALFEGYGSVRQLPPPDVVSLYRDVHLLRRAGEAFRRREPDWVEQAVRVVALVRSADLSEHPT